MDKNIIIPLFLFYKIIDLLETWDIQDYCQATQEDYSDVLFALTKKRQNLELREAYARIIYADSEEAQHEARMSYLRSKRSIVEPF